jgi:hypothetical protein
MYYFKSKNRSSASDSTTNKNYYKSKKYLSKFIVNKTTYPKPFV